MNFVVFIFLKLLKLKIAQRFVGRPYSKKIQGASQHAIWYYILGLRNE